MVRPVRFSKVLARLMAPALNFLPADSRVKSVPSKVVTNITVENCLCSRQENERQQF
jgi:hypothetical protein